MDKPDRLACLLRLWRLVDNCRDGQRIGDLFVAMVGDLSLDDREILKQVDEWIATAHPSQLETSMTDLDRWPPKPDIPSDVATDLVVTDVLAGADQTRIRLLTAYAADRSARDYARIRVLVRAQLEMQLATCEAAINMYRFKAQRCRDRLKLLED